MPFSVPSIFGTFCPDALLRRCNPAAMDKPQSRPGSSICDRSRRADGSLPAIQGAECRAREQPLGAKVNRVGRVRSAFFTVADRLTEDLALSRRSGHPGRSAILPHWHHRRLCGRGSCSGRRRAALDRRTPLGGGDRRAGHATRFARHGDGPAARSLRRDPILPGWSLGHRPLLDQDEGDGRGPERSISRWPATVHAAGSSAGA